MWAHYVPVMVQVEELDSSCGFNFERETTCLDGFFFKLLQKSETPKTYGIREQ